MKTLTVVLILLLVPAICVAGPLQSIQSHWSSDKWAHGWMGLSLDLMLKEAGWNRTNRILAVYAFAVVKEKTDSRYDAHDIGATMIGVGVGEIWSVRF